MLYRPRIRRLSVTFYINSAIPTSNIVAIKVRPCTLRPCIRNCAAKPASVISSSPVSKLRLPEAARNTQVFSRACKRPNNPIQHSGKIPSRHQGETCRKSNRPIRKALSVSAKIPLRRRRWICKGPILAQLRSSVGFVIGF